MPSIPHGDPAMKKLARGITNFRKAVILLGAALFLPVAVAGCNTVAGLGADVEAAGDAIEDKAEESKKY